MPPHEASMSSRSSEDDRVTPKAAATPSTLRLNGIVNPNPEAPSASTDTPPAQQGSISFPLPTVSK
ncbi:UNVERIFIED_CONTAM: hypothetical protein GTU68_011691, partial [Idotea baltica]|nr:hypothetical protein [Idotea baltica]